MKYLRKAVALAILSVLFVAPPALAASVDADLVDAEVEVVPEAPMFEPLTEQEMAEVEGGYCLGCRVGCAIAGAAAGGWFGPGAGVFVALACIEATDPQGAG